MAVLGILVFAGTCESSTTYTYKLTSKEITVKLPISHVYTTDYLKGLVGAYSIQYGLTQNQYLEMMATIQAESGWQIYPKPNGISFGIAQFIPKTFYANCVGELLDPLSQIKCMAIMFSKHQEPQWDEWCMIFGKDNISCKKRGL